MSFFKYVLENGRRLQTNIFPLSGQKRVCKMSLESIKAIFFYRDYTLAHKWTCFFVIPK